MPKNWNRESFKNIGSSGFPAKKKSFFSEKINDPLAETEWEDDLAWEEEALSDPISIESQKRSSNATKDDGFSIPEVNLPEDNFPRPGKKIQEPAGYLSIYFLKFYGQGKNSQSQLVKVTRQFPGGDPVNFVLRELLSGPNADEKMKGVLNSLPRKLTFDQNYRLENGILHLSFSRDLGYSGSPEILKDRLDQLCYSFIGNYGITGVSLYVGSSRLVSLGGDGMNLPDVLVKNPRKVILF